MATKTKPAKADRRAEAFNLKVEALDGLLRVAAKLAGQIEDAGIPPHLDGMDRELNAIWGVLPVLAGALSSYGPGHYDDLPPKVLPKPGVMLWSHLPSVMSRVTARPSASATVFVMRDLPTTRPRAEVS